MYKTILVPLDGSKRAERVLSHMEELAQRCEAEVVLFTVAEPPSFAVGSEGVRVSLYQQELEQMDGEAEAYLKGYPGRVPRERHQGSYARRPWLRGAGHWTPLRKRMRTSSPWPVTVVQDCRGFSTEVWRQGCCIVPTDPCC